MSSRFTANPPPTKKKSYKEATLPSPTILPNNTATSNPPNQTTKLTGTEPICDNNNPNSNNFTSKNNTTGELTGNTGGREVEESREGSRKASSITKEDDGKQFREEQQAKDEVEDKHAAFADAKAQRIFEADPTFGVNWQECCDSGAADLTFAEERESESLGRVRKYKYTYDSFGGPDNDMGYPQYTTTNRYIFLRLQLVGRKGWKQCSGWGDAVAPAAIDSKYGWFNERGIAPCVGQTPGRQPGGRVG